MKKDNKEELVKTAHEFEQFKVTTIKKIKESF